MHFQYGALSIRRGRFSLAKFTPPVVGLTASYYQTGGIFMHPAKKRTGIRMPTRILGSPSMAIEAFSENGLYSSRGMQAMKEYKTVKEVCALTGLTRKHLYYFHHENVVQAAAYANYSVEGNDGYKLYDDAAVERLQEIALYYQLGLKRNEIRDIMLDPEYDVHRVLEKLLSQKMTEKEKIQRQIRILNYLEFVGIQKGLADVLKGDVPEALELSPWMGV